MTSTSVTINNERKVIDIKEAKIMKVAERKDKTNSETKATRKIDLKLIRTQNYNNQAVGDLNKLGNCPRYVDDVYTLGINLHYYAGAIYLELADLYQGYCKAQFKNLALKELQGKQEIERFAKHNYNQLLMYFYDNGGPIIEAPVSEKMKNELQSTFDGILAEFLSQLSTVANAAAIGKMTARELAEAINSHMIATYTEISKLYGNKEIQNAFDELITIRKAVEGQLTQEGHSL